MGEKPGFFKKFNGFAKPECFMRERDNVAAIVADADLRLRKYRSAQGDGAIQIVLCDGL
jgi:hypothetical protein